MSVFYIIIGFLWSMQEKRRRNTLNSRTIGIVSYLTWIGWIVAIICGDRNDGFVRHHLNQALVLNIISAVCGVLARILGAIPVIRLLSGVVFGIIGIVMLVLAIMGIISAANDDTKPLPVVGGIRII